MRLQATDIVLALLAIVTLCCCSDDTCYDNRSAVPSATFYASGTTSQFKADVVTIGGIGAPGDSLIVDSTSASKCALPLRPNVTQSRFFIKMMCVTGGDTTFVTDTLTLSYTPLPYFVSHECGAMYYYHIDGAEVTTHNVDSIAITNADVTNVTRETLRIYVPTE